MYKWLLVGLNKVLQGFDELESLDAFGVLGFAF
jgi:hypothetical protein